MAATILERPTSQNLFASTWALASCRKPTNLLGNHPLMDKADEVWGRPAGAPKLPCNMSNQAGDG
jgi:hypothetical protein